MKFRMFCLTAVMATLSFSSPTLAKQIDVSPSQVRILEADESGLTKIAVNFDLTSIPESEERQIDWAYLEWNPSSTVPHGETDTRSFELREIITEWTMQSNISATEEASDSWDIEAAEYDRDQGAYVRLNVTMPLVEWNNQGTAPHGFLIVTSALSAEAASEQLETIKLRVGYGNRPD